MDVPHQNADLEGSALLRVCKINRRLSGRIMADVCKDQKSKVTGYNSEMNLRDIFYLRLVSSWRGRKRKSLDFLSLRNPLLGKGKLGKAYSFTSPLSPPCEGGIGKIIIPLPPLYLLLKKEGKEGWFFGMVSRSNFVCQCPCLG